MKPPVIRFETEKKTYRLVFTTNAVVEIEDRLGPRRKDPDVLTRIGTTRMMLHAGLMEYHPDLTERDVGDIMDEIGLERAAEIVGEGFLRANGKPSDDPTEGKPTLNETAAKKRSARSSKPAATRNSSGD